MTLVLSCLLMAQSVVFYLALSKVWKIGAMYGAKATTHELMLQLRASAVQDLKPKPVAVKN